MSLFFHTLGAAEQSAHDNALKLLAGAMPAVMGEAQIREYEDNAHKLAGLVAQKQDVLDQEQKKAAPMIANFKRYKDAYDRLSTQAESMGVEVDNPSATLSSQQREIVDALNAALAEATRLKPMKKDAETRVAQAQHDLEDMRRDADLAAQQAVTARQRSEDKQRELQHLAEDEAREKQRLHDQQVAAGMVHGIDGAHAVDDAMDAQIADRRKRVAAAHQEAESYRKATDAANPTQPVNSALAAALAAGDSPTASGPVDLKARRAALDD